MKEVSKKPKAQEGTKLDEKEMDPNRDVREEVKSMSTSKLRSLINLCAGELEQRALSALKMIEIARELDEKG